MPIALDPDIEHENAPVDPDEVRYLVAVTGRPLGLPEKYWLSLELLWVSGGVSDPTLDELVLKRERAVDAPRFLEMLLEVEAFHLSAVLLTRCEVELEAQFDDPARLFAKKKLELAFPFLTFFRGK